MQKFSVIIFGSICIAIFAISKLGSPSPTNETVFWLKTLWIVFLVFLNWVSSSAILFKIKDAQKPALIGSLPGINIVIFIYSLISAGLLIIHWEKPATSSHLIFQVIFGTICFVIVMLSLISAEGAKLPSIPDNAVNKDEIVRLLKRVEKRFSGKELEGISDIRKILQYSAPHTSKIILMPEYENLCVLAKKLENEDQVGESIFELVEKMRWFVSKCC
jgi:hypothetical protein